MSDPRLGGEVVHRRYVAHDAVHYGGGLVDGAYLMRLWGEAATELCIRTDGDEGLLAGYREVRFVAPVRAGDVLEVSARVQRVGRRSRELVFEARVVARSQPERGPAAAGLVDPPLVVGTAVGTVVVSG
jgi:3-aminobutyryl-CoA ammonia-lyase